MNRRNFIKKTALATAGAVVATPVTAMMNKVESAGLLDNNDKQTQQESPNGKVPKVLLVNGSPRPDGNTFCCLKEIETQLQKLGVESEIVQIGRKPVRMCINCGGCREKGADGCVFDDDL